MNLERYISTRDWKGRKCKPKRMVNQPEIVEYFRQNPGRTESQMQEDVYGYFRNETYSSNKKYADCLRRALNSGKLYRERIDTDKGKRFVYYATPNHLTVNQLIDFLTPLNQNDSEVILALGEIKIIQKGKTTESHHTITQDGNTRVEKKPTPKYLKFKVRNFTGKTTEVNFNITYLNEPQLRLLKHEINNWEEKHKCLPWSSEIIHLIDRLVYVETVKQVIELYRTREWDVEDIVSMVMVFKGIDESVES